MIKRPHITSFLLIGIVALAASVACSRASSDVERTPEPQVFDDSIPRGENGQILTPRDQLEAIGDANPGFGGFVVDPEDGSVTVLMTDIEDREHAERAAGQAAGIVLSEDTVQGDVKIARADFAYTDLASWYRKVQAHVWPEFVGVVVNSGISTSENRIHIGITDLSARERIEDILLEQGIPLAAVEIRQGGGFSLLSE